MSLRVLILPEDYVRDEHVLLPIVRAMMAEVGKPKARVVVCKEPRFHGIGEALKWPFISQALDRYRGKFDLCLLCVDRDGEAGRRDQLDRLEGLAADVIGAGRAFFAENAWQELEVWVLAGHDLPDGWDWKTIRDERHPKERYFVPFAKGRGVIDQPGEGRGKLAIEASKRFGRVRARCQEDIQNLEARIKVWVDATA